MKKKINYLYTILIFLKCFLLYHAVPLGSIQELPAESCSEIKDSEANEMVNGDYWIYSDGTGQTILARCEGTSSLFISKPCSPSVKILKRLIDQPIKFGASNLKFIVSASSSNGF